MSGANYEHCPGCERKALYVGEDEVPGGVEVWHGECVARKIAEAAAAERARLYAELGNDHYVIFTEDRFTVEHPVECRLSGDMPHCEWHAAVARFATGFDPDMAGRWLVTSIDPDGDPVLAAVTA